MPPRARLPFASVLSIGTRGLTRPHQPSGRPPRSPSSLPPTSAPPPPSHPRPAKQRSGSVLSSVSFLYAASTPSILAKLRVTRPGCHDTLSPLATKSGSRVFLLTGVTALSLRPHLGLLPPESRRSEAASRIRSKSTTPDKYMDSLSSPHRRLQSSSSLPSPFKKTSGRDELGGWSVLLERHRFLLTALALLAFLCTVYLYFAVTLGAAQCSGLAGAERALCQAKSSILRGRKLKFL